MGEELGYSEYNALYKRSILDNADTLMQLHDVNCTIGDSPNDYMVTTQLTHDQNQNED